MEFPMRLLIFRLVDFVQKKDGTFFVRYLYKGNEGKKVYMSITKKDNLYIFKMTSTKGNRCDKIIKKYENLVIAQDYMLERVIKFRL